MLHLGPQGLIAFILIVAACKCDAKRIIRSEHGEISRGQMANLVDVCEAPAELPRGIMHRERRER